MKHLIILSLIALGVFTNHSAEASLAYLTMSHEFGPWTAGGTPGYGWVDITKQEDGYLHVTVNANRDYFSTTNGQGISLDQFYFNFSGNKPLDAASIKIDESTGNWQVVKNPDVSVFNRYDFGIIGDVGASPPLGTLHFHIADPSVQLADIVSENADGWTFAGHLKGFDYKGNLWNRKSNNTFLAAETMAQPVPLPAGFILLGTGLAGLVLGRRRLPIRAQE